MSFQGPLLVLERVAEVLEEEDEKGGNDEGFIEDADSLVVDCFAHVDEREPGGDCVNGDHKQHSDDVSLLVGLSVFVVINVRSMKNYRRG